MAIALGDFAGNGSSPAPVLDFGLRRLNLNANRVVLCSATPVTYAQVGTFLLGTATPSPVFALPSNYPPGGRQALLTAISNGTITVGGTATTIAIVDDTNLDLLLTATLNVSTVVAIGYTWTLASFAVAITNGQILLLTPTGILDSAPSLGIPSLSLPTLGLTASANGRYIVTANGTPLLLFADSAQGLARLPEDTVQTYINTRASQGFNAIQFDLVTDSYVGNANANFGTDTDTAFPTSFSPFTATNGTPVAPDITKPDTTNYWPRMDRYVQMLATKNMVAILNPIEPSTLAASPSGFTSLNNALTVNGAAAIVNFGQFVGARYANNANVIWHLGNDYDDSSASTHLIMTSLINGVLAGSPNRLMTMVLATTGSPNLTAGKWSTTYSAASVYDSTSTQASFNVTPALNLNGFYTYSSVYAEGALAYLSPSQTFAGAAGQNRTTPAPTPVPAILTKANYANENVFATNNDGGGTLRSNIRRQSYWSVLGGGSGQIYGCHLVWNFASGYTSALTDPSVTDLQTWNTFFTGMPWWTLTPDFNHTVGTVGFGTPGLNNVMSTDAYITVAASSTLAVAYFGNNTVNASLTINLATFAPGTVTGQFFDPTNGKYIGTVGSPYASTGTHSFLPAGTNSLGDPDWVLLLSVPTANPVVNNASFTMNVPTTSGQVIGTMTAVNGVNSPTAWMISAISGPGTPSTTWFAIDTAPSDATFGQITVTATGASNLTGSVNGNVYTLTVRATNAFGASTGSATVTAHGLTATAVLVAGQTGPGITVTVASAQDAGAFIGAISVTTNAPGTYVGTISLGGTDGAKFSFSGVTNISSASFPCNLFVGQTAITVGGGSGPGGSYAITLTATP